jgi:hypothetical protein
LDPECFPKVHMLKAWSPVHGTLWRWQNHWEQSLVGDLRSLSACYWRALWTLSPFIVSFCTLAMRWMNFLCHTHLHHDVFPCHRSKNICVPTALRPKHPKLWAEIKLSSFEVDYLRYFVIVRENWLTQKHKLMQNQRT